ncbi:MAG: hypothetical protein ACI9GH_000056 [Candidatus Paceibacteria bacterium]|jgi:hypothetical protein
MVSAYTNSVMMNKKPNFFIIGAPKCGTTSVSEYLREHPDVFFSNPKEPNYFNTDFNKEHRKFLTEEEYLERCFSDSEGYKMAGEGTVFYLYSKEAVSNILKFNPDSKFIVMLRNPVDTAYSWHSQSLKTFKEDIKDFKKVWRLIGNRKNGKDIPKGCHDSKRLFYDEIFKFGEQMERLYNQVDPKNVHVIFYKDLNRNTLNEYKKTLEFLGIEYDGRTDFPIYRKNKTVRYSFLRRSINNILKIKNKIGLNLNTGLITKFLSKSVVVKERKNLDVEFKKELVNFFSEDIKKLSRITGRDLSAWLK